MPNLSNKNKRLITLENIRMNNRKQRFKCQFRLSQSVATLQLISFSLLLTGVLGCDNGMETSETQATTVIQPEGEINSKPKVNSRILTRLFWQDRMEGTVYTGDLLLKNGEYAVAKQKVKGFPELNPADNDLVQMQVSRGRLIVGVRDHADGKDNSGWIEINTGVEEESHGDHSHWHYDSDASVCAVTLDEKQGNPAHVYQYGHKIYIANDKNNGFTQIQTAENKAPSKAKFFHGGGGHITLAAVADRIAYSTWIDRSGDNTGRVDVIDLRNQSTEPRYSFNLPLGGIHGAGACGNRVYFAPANGVCWVNCDFDFAENRDTVMVQHLSLDESPEGTDYRTGAFKSFEDHILCLANSRSGNPNLCVINATAPQPVVTRIPCGELEDGFKISSVNATKIAGNKCLAFAFAEGDGLDEKLLIFELDPNGDRNFSDAKLSNSIKIGPSKLDRHFGHHGVTFLDNRKIAIVTNPGDGTLTIIDLVNQKVQQTIDIGGEPTKLTAYGRAM